MRETVRRTQEHRRRVAALVSSDALGLPASVVEYLDALRRHGLSERGISIERDGWIMLATHSPDRVDGWIRLKREGLEDPAYLAWVALGELLRQRGTTGWTDLHEADQDGPSTLS